MQRGENFELSYTHALGSRSVSVGAYRESVTECGADHVRSGRPVRRDGDILPDLFSGNEVFNAGNYHSVGYSASLTQNLGDNFSATLIYGSLGALTVDDRELETNNPDELRQMIRAGRRHAATARVSATLPATGTHVVTSYQWTDNRTLTPGHLYSTQTVRPEPGFNLFVRQPIPTSIFPWRMEISADLRNLLAQGYLPLASPGRRVLLMQTPRTFRGGLHFALHSPPAFSSALNAQFTGRRGDFELRRGSRKCMLFGLVHPGLNAGRRGSREFCSSAASRRLGVNFFLQLTGKWFHLPPFPAMLLFDSTSPHSSGTERLNEKSQRPR